MLQSVITAVFGGALLLALAFPLMASALTVTP
jgi:hypothetical protein